MELEKIKYQEQLLSMQNNFENMRNEMWLQMLAQQMYMLNNQNLVNQNLVNQNFA